MDIKLQKKSLKVALDIDGVCANFAQGFIERAQELELGHCFPKSHQEVESWDFNGCRKCRKDVFDLVWKSVSVDMHFWLNLKPFPGAANFTHEIVPVAYVTSRRIPTTITRTWLDGNGFYLAPVYSVDHPSHKKNILKELEIDLFVDDKPETVKQLNKAKIKCVLYRQPHNRHSSFADSDCISCLSELLTIDRNQGV